MKVTRGAGFRWMGGVMLLLALGLGVAAAQDEAGPQRGGGFAGGQMIRGIVTAASGDKLTLKTEQGEQYQVVTTTNTRIMKDRQPVKLAEIPVGAGVGAVGLLDAPTRTVHAMMVMVIDPEQVKKAREGMGKVYIAGKITKMDETKLTVLRSDGVTQTIEVDETTSFKRGGRGMRMAMDGGPMPTPSFGSGDGGAPRTAPPAESITLMDLKVGDTVVGQGALKNGVFVPKDLSVVPPGAGRQRRRPAEGGATGASQTGSPAGQAPPQ